VFLIMTNADPADPQAEKVQARVSPTPVDGDATAPADAAIAGAANPPTARSRRSRAVDPEPPAAATDGESADDAGAADAAVEVSPAASRWQQVLDKRRNKKQRPFWIELPILIVVAFTLTFLIQTFVAKVYYIPSGSMEQTLHGAPEGGDRVLVNKVLYKFTDPSPGDVVVFRGPANWAPEVAVNKPTTWYGKALQALGAVVGIAPPDEKDFVKRVIATGGQTVLCCDQAGNVTVDGVSLTEPYIFENVDPGFGPGDNCTSSPRSNRCFGPYTIPDGQLWMMGDHRGFSSDSAYGCRGQEATPPITQCRGPISLDDVIGKAAVVVMPISRWKFIDDPDIQQGPQALGMSEAPQGVLGAVVTFPATPAVIGFAGVFGLRLGTRGWVRRRRRRAGN